VPAAPSQPGGNLGEEFERLTGRPPEGIWSAPGRANLIGEHLDYNGGSVLPFALPLRTTVAIARRSDGVVRAWSRQSDISGSCRLDEPWLARGWIRYVVGTGWALHAAGGGTDGFDVLVNGEVPVGAGLSSSAALCCAVAVALDDLGDRQLDRMALALAAQRAERDVVGAPIGLMDQVASLFGRAGHLVHFDTATATLAHIEVQLAATGTAMVVVDTGERHDIAAGDYADRRAACESAAARLRVEWLAAADLQDLGSLSDEVRLQRRARHVITEEQRVHTMLGALTSGDMALAGRLLLASHTSLRDDFAVSTPTLDATVSAAMAGGAHGARLVGGGFGGSVLVLLPESAFDEVTAVIAQRAAVAERPRPLTYRAAPADGARRDS
jgi:galactokinase